MKRTELKSKKKLLAAAVLTSGLMILAGCSGKSGITGEQLPYPLQVKAYFDKDMSNASRESTAPAAYFDLSDGIIVAYKTNPDCGAFLNQITQKITSGESDVYAVANDTIMPLEMKQTALYNKIMDASSYRQIMAPIEKTLDKITSEGNSALLVTDFEEYTPDRRVQHASFATKYFKKWLVENGDITFFVFNYSENRQDKHLYFIVFDTKDHHLLNKVREATKGYSGYQEFCLSRDAYSSSNSYATATTGGSYHSAEHNEDLVTAVVEDGSPEAYTRYGEGNRVEYYPLGEPWKNIVSNAREMTQPGTKPLYTNLLRGLFFNFSNQDSYIIRKLDVLVSDVEDDFTRFEENRLAVTATNKEEDYHYDADGNMLPEYEYSAPGNIIQIKDMLCIDQQLFDQSMKESGGSKVEIGINMTSSFTGQVIGGKEGDLLRVDVCIAESEPNLGPRLDELFFWGQNGSLRDAIRNTLQEVNPRGTVIYTYFLKEL